MKYKPPSELEAPWSQGGGSSYFLDAQPDSITNCLTFEKSLNFSASVLNLLNREIIIIYASGVRGACQMRLLMEVLRRPPGIFLLLFYYKITAYSNA